MTCRAKPFQRLCVSDGDFLLVSLQAMTLHLATCNEQAIHSGPCYTGLHHSAANKACCSGVLIFPRPWNRVAESRARMEVASGVIGLASLPARPFPGGSLGQRMLFSRGFPHAVKMCDLQKRCPKEWSPKHKISCDAIDVSHRTPVSAPGEASFGMEQ